MEKENYTILICDDAPVECEFLEGIFTEYAELYHISIKTEVFYTGESLYEYIKNHSGIDLLFLDINLPGINGAGVGNRLREALGNNSVQIVYISSSTTYVMELFRARPFDFLIKPINKRMIEDVFERYMEIYSEKKGYFEYKTGKSSNKVCLTDIMYFASEGRKVNIVTKYGIISFYGRIRDIHGKHEKDGFWTIHNSYIINVAYVKEFKKNTILMCDDTEIPVSRPYRQDVNRKMFGLLR